MSKLTIGSGLGITTSLGSSTKSTWTKPSDWPELPTITASDNKFAGLYAVWPNQDNFIALTASCNSGTSGYTVDWGDGSIETFGAGVAAYHNYDYNDADITVTCSRGYKIVTVQVYPTTSGHTFYTLSLATKHNQTGLASYYTTGWLDIAFAGTAIGSTNLTIGNTNPIQHRNLERARFYALNNWLGGSLFTGCTNLRSVTMPANTAFFTTTANMFNSCYAITDIPIFDTANVTTMQSMFDGCYSLQSVPLFNTNKVTNMSYMFRNCYSLQIVPKFNTANVTTMQNMFSVCRTLKSVPEFNTANVTIMAYMFTDASGLQTVPKFNTSKVTNMSNMFSGADGLISVPAFDTANVTDMSGMFYDCYGLTAAPPMNTSKVTSMASMFSMFYGTNAIIETVPTYDTANVIYMYEMFRNCSGLKTVPNFNTSKANTMYGMFYGCHTLQSIPTLDTANNKVFDYFFYNCYALQSAPVLNTANGQSFINMFSGCTSLPIVPAINVSNTTVTGNYTSMFTNMYSCANIAASQFKYSFSVAGLRLSNTALNFIYTNLPTVTGQSITITGNYGANTSNTTIANSKGWAIVN